MKNSYSFDGQTIVITGGAGGIGVECAKIFAEGGAHIHLVDPRAEALEAAVETAGPGQFTTHVSSLEGPQACADALDSAGVPPYGLIHLAGLFEPDPFDPSVQDVWDRAIQVNLKSAYDPPMTCPSRLNRGALKTPSQGWCLPLLLPLAADPRTLRHTAAPRLVCMGWSGRWRRSSRHTYW
jgi:NAD(P)-dependent dehydrogenase (short-subunit alcohol dehydrogenase family)